MTTAVAFLLLSSLALTLQGQAPTDVFEKAPPGVEDALRERVNGFYQCWTDGKFRAAEKFVGADAQEFYYSMQKQKFAACEIIRIKYQSDFKDAIVTVSCKGKWNISGKELDSTLAHTDFWSLEKDQWAWTIKPVTSQETPFGTSHYDYANIESAQKLFDPQTGLPKDFDAVGKAILSQVSIDKQSIELSSFKKSSAIVTIRNGINGYIDVEAVSNILPPGLTLTFDHSKIPAQGEAHLTIAYDPKGDKSAKPGLTITINVEQTRAHFPLQVTFAIPEEIQKLLDKSKNGK